MESIAENSFLVPAMIAILLLFTLHQYDMHGWLASYPVPLKKGLYRLSTHARIITSLSGNNVSQMTERCGNTTLSVHENR